MLRSPDRQDRFIFTRHADTRGRSLLLVAVAVLVAIGIVGYLTGCYDEEPVAEGDTLSPNPDAASIGYASLNPDESLLPDYREGWILPYKGFEDSLLAIEGTTLANVLEITNAIRDHIDFSRIYAGESLRLWFDADGKVQRFTYSPNIVTFHNLVRSGKTGKFEYSYTRLPTETRRRIIAGEMQGTLNASLAQRQDVTTWIRQAVNNALEGMISFNTDARNGDRYRILVEEEFSGGRRIPGGRVLYASYEGKVAGRREAFLYRDPEPDSAFNAHYTVEGKALASSGMRLPVDRIRVTSTFGYRIHPITGRRQMHNGVDYAGALGDPVYAVTAGTVTFAAMDGASGRKIIIRHLDGTLTYYLHLSAIGVRNGQAVKTGQIIGRVGSTGLSSGPHLHFGIFDKKQGWVNPLRIKMIAAPTLAGERFERFKGQMRDIRALLERTAVSD